MPGLHERRHLHRNTVQETTNHENNKGAFGTERLGRARQAQTQYFENMKETTKKAAVKAPSPLSFSNPMEMLKHALKLKETEGGESEKKADNPQFVAEDPVADVDGSDESTDDQDEPKSIGAIFKAGHAKAKAKPAKAPMGPPKPLPKATPLTRPPPPKHTGPAAASTCTGNPPDAIVAKGGSTRREQTKLAGENGDEDIKMDGRPLRAKTNLRSLINKAQDAIAKAEDLINTEHEHDKKDERDLSWKKKTKEQISQMRDYVTKLRKK